MLFKLFRWIFVIPILVIWYSAASIYIYAERTDIVSADAAIVLGAAALGNRPSPIFRERINHGIQLYEQGAVEKLVFTGGFGWRDRLPEAEVGRNYALARGVPAEAIVVETESTNTAENLINVAEISAENNLDSFIIVSTPFHMRRAMFIADQLGLDAYASPTRSTAWRPGGSRSWLVTREVIAFIVYRINWQSYAPS